MATALEEALEGFVVRLSQDRLTLRMLADWRRRILIEASDTRERFLIVSTGTGVGPVEHPTGGEEDMCIAGQAAVLAEIFLGTRDPMVEYLAGRIAYRGTQPDEIRLDAVVRSMWDGDA